MIINIIKNKSTNIPYDYVYKDLSQNDREELDWAHYHPLHCLHCGERLGAGYTFIIRNLEDDHPTVITI